MKNVVPKHVVTYRREKIVKLAEEYNLTPEILAEFFQVPVKVIKNDIQPKEKEKEEREPITIVKEGLKVFCVYDEKIKLENAVKDNVKGRNINRRDWAYEGFWMEPKYFGDDCRDLFLNNPDLHRRRLMQRAYSMYRLGYTISDVRSICKLTRMETELVKKACAENRENGFLIWAITQYTKGSSYTNEKIVASAVGVSAEKLLKGEKYFYDVLKKQGKKPATLKEPKHSKEMRNELKKEMYLEWKEGKTQKELAEELAKKRAKEIGRKLKKKEVDNLRVTIGNWIREMKAQETDDIYSLSWRRNTSEKGRKKSDKKKAKRRENCLNKIRPLIDEGASLNHMAKVSGNCAETIKRYMRDAGLWEEYLKKRPELNK